MGVGVGSRVELKVPSKARVNSHVAGTFSHEFPEKESNWCRQQPRFRTLPGVRAPLVETAIIVMPAYTTRVPR